MDMLLLLVALVSFVALVVGWMMLPSAQPAVGAEAPQAMRAVRAAQG